MRKFNTLFKRYINDYRLVPEFSTIIFALIVMAVAIFCFYELTQELSENELKIYDDFIIAKVVGLRSPLNTQIMKSMTVIGNSVGYFLIVPILAIFFIIRKRWRISLQITLVILMASGLNTVLKNMIGRDRPPEIGRLVDANFYSFPSGHAMSAIVFYGFIIYLSIILIKMAWLKYGLICICVLMIFLIGLSRIYLGVHYPSDILAGYFGGIAWLMFCILVLNLITLSKMKLEEAKILNN